MRMIWIMCKFITLKNQNKMGHENFIKSNCETEIVIYFRLKVWPLWCRQLEESKVWSSQDQNGRIRNPNPAKRCHSFYQHSQNHKIPNFGITLMGTAYDWVVRRRCRRSPTFSIKSYNTCCIVTLKSILNIV